MSAANCTFFTSVISDPPSRVQLLRAHCSHAKFLKKFFSRLSAYMILLKLKLKTRKIKGQEKNSLVNERRKSLKILALEFKCWPQKADFSLQ